MTTVVSEASTPDASPATSSWVSLAQDVADGLVSPWAAAGSLGSWADEELLALPSEDAVAVLDLSRRLAAAAEAVQLVAIEAVARRDEDTVEEMEERWQRDQRARGVAGGSDPRGR